MPVMSGYSATHRIRHHTPYATMENIRTIPIVAMTASAIQGDKEKCQRAGMDDYLAKPVTGKTLEIMLVKWALAGRNPQLRAVSMGSADHGSDCTDPEHEAHGRATTRLSKLKPGSENSEAARAIAESSALPGADSGGNMGLQRTDAEEKATFLRDYKLLAASEAHRHQPTPAVGPTQAQSTRLYPPMALTEENMGKLDRELDETTATNPPVPPSMPESSNSAHSSGMQVESSEDSPAGSTLGELDDSTRQKRSWWTRAVRSRLSRTDSDQTEITITPTTQED